MNRQAQRKKRWPARIAIISYAVVAITSTYALVVNWASDGRTTRIILILGILSEVCLIIVWIVSLRRQQN